MTEAKGNHQEAVLAALAANLAIAVAKMVGFAFTGAASLLAEAIHSVADTANQGLLVLGTRRARKAPDDSHPFGYAREHFDVSRQIGERRLLPAARAMQPGDVLVAAGTSCRQQVRDFTGIEAMHPAQLLRSLL